MNGTSTLSIQRFLGGATLVMALCLGAAGCGQEIINRAPSQRADGIRAYEEGNYADAAGSFRQAIRSDPRDYKSQFYLGQSYENLRQYQQAIQAYKAALDTMQTTLEGQEDKEFRYRIMDGLASAIAKSDDRHLETDLLEQQATGKQAAEGHLQLAKIYRQTGDADSAMDSYNRALLLDPENSHIAKEYGLYLDQLNQQDRAELFLRKAYQLNPSDTEVAAALRRMGIVPGPSLKNEEQLAQPPLPKGPLPEVNLRTIVPARRNNATPVPAEQPVQNVSIPQD